jgi:beta-mannosidase
MKQIPLREGWLMASERDTLGGDPTGTDCQPQCWLPVEVPTTVQAALVDHGRAPDPWLDFNAKAFKAFEQETWWFRHEFELPEDADDYDAWELRFEGVSLFGMVWLNGDPVGYTHNAHHAHSVDITAYVNASGPNVLALTCGLNLDQIRQSVRPEIRSMPDCIRAFMRMSQMSSGWDFAPHMLLVGPWRPVTLVGHRKASIEDAFVQTDAINDESADITVAVKLRQFGQHTEPAKLRLSIHEDPESPPVWSDTLDVCGDGSVDVPVTLPNPRLWYPQPMGEPFLYTLKATVECSGEEVDQHTAAFGVRTIELHQDGEFTFAVNGRKVFAKGANWVPPNTLTWDATPETYSHLVELAADANFNMFRIWGGGIYESDTFYDLCDQHGIMVWQDFMFSNTRVADDDPVFMERITREVRTAVTRLRRHASVVLWCGNNECLEAWNVGEWPEEADRHFGERVYYSVLPQTVRQLSPGTPYWPGSPCGGSTTRSLEVGDFHDWYSLPNWRTYDDNAPRFSSEYGCRSVPQRETVDAMISPEFQWDGSGHHHTVWQFHHGWCGALKQMLPEFGDPATLDEYIALSQELQATLMSYAVEVYRRRMFATSGSLIWQYNEPWPAVTFSMVDFFGRAKASYYWVRRACAPVIGMFYAKDGHVSFWGVNDLCEEKACSVRLRRFDHAGTMLGEASFDGLLAPNTATQIVETLPESLRIGIAEDEFLHAELRCGDTVSECVHHSAFRKDWRLPQTELTATCERADADAMRVTLASPGYVHFAGLTVEDPHARFSDNFIDLLPGEPRTIDIRTREAGTITIRAANAEQLEVAPLG